MTTRTRTEPALRTSGLSLAYGSTEILHELDLELPAGIRSCPDRSFR